MQLLPALLRLYQCYYARMCAYTAGTRADTPPTAPTAMVFPLSLGRTATLRLSVLNYIVTSNHIHLLVETGITVEATLTASSRLRKMRA
jgi:hypothetical protein